MIAWTLLTQGGGVASTVVVDGRQHVPDCHGILRMQAAKNIGNKKQATVFLLNSQQCQSLINGI